MTLHHKIQFAVAVLLAALTPLAAAQNPSTTTAPAPAAQAVKQKFFATPEAAAQALADAVRARDPQALLAVVGPASRDWLLSGDRVADRNDWAKFLAAYDRKSAIRRDGDTKAVLVVGDDWPFPAPLRKWGDRWAFDAAAGREEIINRRIGHNELDTVQTLLAIVDAQREYAAADPDHSGFEDYARRFISSDGKKDGLYWPTPPGARSSPLGPLVGDATREGYRAKGGPRPYHGYYYRMLMAQGQDANGGAYDYLVNGQLIGGFAVVAYPAKYGVSGVMTFVVNHDGVVYEKDLGKTTVTAAAKMARFNPDKTWKKSPSTN